MKVTTFKSNTGGQIVRVKNWGDVILEVTLFEPTSQTLTFFHQAHVVTREAVSEPEDFLTDEGPIKRQCDCESSPCGGCE